MPRYFLYSENEKARLHWAGFLFFGRGCPENGKRVWYRNAAASRFTFSKGETLWYASVSVAKGRDGIGGREIPFSPG